MLEFDVSGPGKLIGTGNANPVSTESYLRSFRKAWHGRCLAIIKSEHEPGTITIKVYSPGFEQAILEIDSE
jgi:beta-galactosidase